MRSPRIGLAISIAVLAAGFTVLPANAVASGKIGWASNLDGDQELFVQNSDGSGLGQYTRNGSWDGDLAWSPDGTKLAFSRVTTGGACLIGCKNVFEMNADGTELTQLTFETIDTRENRAPAWSPDGSTIVYNSTHYGGKDLFTIPASGGSPTRLTTDPANDFAPTWSGDGQTIAFVSTRGGAAAIWTMSATGGGQAALALSGPQVPGALIGDPDFSSDGTQLAFRGATDQWSATRVFVANADGTGTHEVWADPGAVKNAYDPAWSPDDGELAFAVDTTTTTGFDLAILDLATATTSWAVTDLGDDLNPDWTTGQAPVLAGDPVAAHVHVDDYAYTPSSPSVPFDGIVSWDFAGPSKHTATDKTGMGLYDSGALAAGAGFTYSFDAAGVYAFGCTIHPRKMAGSVSVPVSLVPTAGGTGTIFSVRWAAQPAPTGFAYDVQILRPGAKSWSSWKSAVTFAQANFVPDSGVGKYHFRARLRLTSKKAAAYSADVWITVS